MLKRRLSDYLHREIWQSSALHDNSLKGRFCSFLRVFSIILDGLTNNRLLSRSAALSYYSLIGLGPLLAIVVMVSGFILQRNEPNLAAHSLNRVLLFIAPPVAEFSRLDQQGIHDSTSASHTGLSAANNPKRLTPELNQDLVALINQVIESTRSGTVGIVGALLLIFIGIQLLTSIETTFNEIWGVRRGRSWFQRIVFYWTFISLGAILGFASVTLLSAATLVRFFDLLPFGEHVSHLFALAGPFLSSFLAMVLLYGFYRLIPNTKVKWKPALAGAIFVTLLLICNNYLSFLYVHRVITQQSLYGSLGIVPVLMIGLYIFWFFVLIGGQITYSIQNADLLTHQSAWNNISVHTRETVALAAFTLICRRFRDCREAYNSGELTDRIRVPGHILNESLNRLTDLGLVSIISTFDNDSENVVRYQPSRPLHNITLADFRSALECYGNNEGAELIHDVDPLITYYRNGFKNFTTSQLGSTSFEQLLNDHLPQPNPPPKQ